MKTAIHCTILLACIGICTSAAIMNCRCVGTRQFVKQSYIADVTLIAPRPYCNKQEVIVQLKNNKSLCLDPNEKFTQELLKRREKMRNTTSPKTTTVSTTTSATTGQTS